MSQIAGKRILLGVSGGIAAYKSVDLVRRLREAGAHVRVVMTAGAEAFVAPLTFQAVSGEPVRDSLFDAAAEAAMGHIELARWADAVLIAPASADILARLRLGLAGDLLATICLATEAPLAVAPAMNRVMWAHPATQDNLRELAGRGVRVFGPASGDQACGETGSGRMLEPVELVEALSGVFMPRVLAGKRLLITAGPTREPIDPVRYITNRSSGKMGFAMAAAAAAAGAEVTVVAGPCALPTPSGVTRTDVETAEEMHRAVFAAMPGMDVFIGTAAVSDYRVDTPAGQKIKKSGDPMALQLVQNPDILAAVAATSNGPFTVGFAAETEQVVEYARAKLERKGLDMIAANRVGEAGLGFDGDRNRLDVIWKDGSRVIGPDSKHAVACELIRLIAERLGARGDEA